MNTHFIQSTCAENRCEDPTLSIAHGAAVGRDPLVKDVSAAAPLCRLNTISVAAVPLPL